MRKSMAGESHVLHSIRLVGRQPTSVSDYQHSKVNQRRGLAGQAKVLSKGGEVFENSEKKSKGKIFPAVGSDEVKKSLDMSTTDNYEVEMLFLLDNTIWKLLMKLN